MHRKILLVVGSASLTLAALVSLAGPTAKGEAKEPMINVSQFRDKIPIGLLGKPLGTRTTIEGSPAKFNAYAITRVDDRALPETVFMELHRAKGIKQGVRYKFEGYESGAFENEPEWYNDKLQRPFGYYPFFVVTSVVELPN